MRKKDNMGRLLLTIIALMLTLAAMAGSRTPVAPPFLKPGDKIYILSPASHESKRAADSAYAALQRWGYFPIMGRNVTSNWHDFAGTLAERSYDFKTALRDTSVKAIFCTIGGYGSMQLLTDSVPLEMLRQNPKWIMGFSDVTALHSAQVAAGVMSVHCNGAATMAMTRGLDTTSRALRGILAGKMPVYQIESDELNRNGTAHGLLVGGNMSLLCAMAGTPYDMLSPEFLDTHDVILFIEDVHENAKHLDRMLHSLKLRGVLDKIKGLIIGQFRDTSYREYGYSSISEMLHGYLKDYPYPIVYNFPVSHWSAKNFPMIEGCPVTLIVRNFTTTLTFNIHEAPQASAPQ